MLKALFINSEAILEALQLLNKRLVYEEHDKIELLICGGAALNLTGAITRTTRDIDAICCVRLIVGAHQLARFEEDQIFDDAVKFVSDALRLPREWINFGPKSLFDFGLPWGTAERMKKFEVGECLTIFTVSRRDQIALKVYAAMGEGKRDRLEVHLSDLLSLEPTREEFVFAKDWLLSKTHSEEYRSRLFKTLETVGYVE